MGFSPDTNGTLTTSLQAYWKLDETSGTRYDAYSSNDMALGTEPGYVAGKIGNAADFNEANSEYLTAGDVAAFESNDFSVSFWIKCVSEGTGYHTIISKANYSIDYSGWWIGMSGTAGAAQHKIWVWVQNAAGTDYVQRYGSTNIADGTWKHVVVTRTGGTIMIYVNGVAETLTDPGSYGSVTSLANAAACTMGARADGVNFLNGAIDEIGYWSKILSAQEIADLYNSGSGNTYSDITTSSSTTTTTSSSTTTTTTSSSTSTITTTSTTASTSTTTTSASTTTSISMPSSLVFAQTDEYPKRAQRDIYPLSGERDTSGFLNE